MTTTDDRVARIMLLETIIDRSPVQRRVIDEVIGEDSRGALWWLIRAGIVRPADAQWTAFEYVAVGALR
ncbi:hypothetical protein [Tsukamurella tyrosinosolvens]|uniref:hypothetical protein n=1 Tax=Tsukamurella tyrosinosolvens TaxID=57704 RepID=UPI002DD42A7A|nr:hypothetical protein [Tsukamurella tyrosinosolvens]MEC4616305.1 hypothetical protein [Tsukamurella tyrosinosolvens]